MCFFLFIYAYACFETGFSFSALKCRQAVFSAPFCLGTARLILYCDSPADSSDTRLQVPWNMDEIVDRRDRLQLTLQQPREIGVAVLFDVCLGRSCFCNIRLFASQLLRNLLILSCLFRDKAT